MKRQASKCQQYLGVAARVGVNKETKYNGIASRYWAESTKRSVLLKSVCLDFVNKGHVNWVESKNVDSKNSAIVAKICTNKYHKSQKIRKQT